MSGNATNSPWRRKTGGNIGHAIEALVTTPSDDMGYHDEGYRIVCSYQGHYKNTAGMGEDEHAEAIADVILEAVNSYASSQAEIERLRQALRNIAEGNLGDDPWQANYGKIRGVAVEALCGTPQTASEAFADWLNKGPKLALAAGCHVGIKVTEAKKAKP